MGRREGRREPQVAVRELGTLRGHADSLLEKRHLDREAGLGGLPRGHGGRLKEVGSRVVSKTPILIPEPPPPREDEGILEQSPAPSTICLSKMALSPSHPGMHPRIHPPTPRAGPLFPTLPTAPLQALFCRDSGRQRGLRPSWCQDPPPCGPRAPCAASGQSPHRSCLCS